MPAAARKRSCGASVARTGRWPWTVEALDRMMDEIAAVASIQQLDYLAAEVVSEFGGHPDLAKLEEMLGAMRRLLEAEGKARRNGLAE